MNLTDVKRRRNNAKGADRFSKPWVPDPHIPTNTAKITKDNGQVRGQRSEVSSEVAHLQDTMFLS